jgi:TonB family protein
VHPEPNDTCEYQNATVLIEFGIAKDGRLVYVKVLKPLGYPTYDEHSIASIKSAAPFPPIPDSLSLKGVPVNAAMNYVVKTRQTEGMK